MLKLNSNTRFCLSLFIFAAISYTQYVASITIMFNEKFVYYRIASRLHHSFQVRVASATMTMTTVGYCEKWIEFESGTHNYYYYFIFPKQMPRCKMNIEYWAFEHLHFTRAPDPVMYTFILPFTGRLVW